MVALFTGMAIFFCIGDAVPVTGLLWKITIWVMFGAMFAKILGTQPLHRHHGSHGTVRIS
jgi:hypothetical protein